MRNRVTKLAAAVAALAALAGGAAAFASGAGKGSAPVSPAHAQAQQGNQATDAQAADRTPGETADNEAASEPADTDNVQQGDQTTPDTVAPSQEEQPTEATSDGPAGYADTVPNANTQQEGEH
jgi:hypothetical protein